MEMNSTGREELKGTCWLSRKKYTGLLFEQHLARRCLFGEQLRAWCGCTLCPFLQERYRQDCNLAVQLLKCNKSHFRNHKFADVSSSPAEAGKEGSWFPPAPCLFPAFSAGLLASHPSAPGRGVGGQRRASASSSFTLAPFHRSCYKKHNNLEFDSLLGACWKLAGGQTSLLPCSVLLPFSPVHVQGPRWQILSLMRSSLGGSVQGVFSAS